eukprot:8415146-Alexandrium_andersonii.AAC.1
MWVTCLSCASVVRCGSHDRSHASPAHCEHHSLLAPARSVAKMTDRSSAGSFPRHTARNVDTDVGQVARNAARAPG